MVYTVYITVHVSHTSYVVYTVNCQVEYTKLYIVISIYQYINDIYIYIYIYIIYYCNDSLEVTVIYYNIIYVIDVSRILNIYIIDIYHLMCHLICL